MHLVSKSVQIVHASQQCNISTSDLVCNQAT